MSEILFPQAVIPTTSLFLIEELVGDKLDDYIVKLKASSAKESTKVIDKRPYPWMTSKMYITPFMFINYDREKNSDVPFGLSIAVETAIMENVNELWINELTLYIAEKNRGTNIYIFKNKPVTKGSDVEKFVYNYYRRRKITGWIKRIPRRHLPLIEARPHPLPKPNAHLDWFQLHNPEFISWLNRTTHGIVLSKIVKKLAGDRLIDVRIEEAEGRG